MDPFFKKEISARDKHCKEYFASSQFPTYLASLGTGRSSRDGGLARTGQYCLEVVTGKWERDSTIGLC